MEQIVYQKTLSEFIAHCANPNVIAKEVRDGMILAGYTDIRPSWETSWKNSLPAIADALKTSKSISMDVDVAVEYRLKHSLERLDFLIYGIDGKGRKNVVIVELKQWSQVSRTESLNRVHTLVAKNHFEDHFHPSYQALNYAGQLRAFNSYVQEEHVGIESCSYCHNMNQGYKTVMGDISLFPFLPDSPSYLQNDGDKLRDFVEHYVSKSCHNILYEINNAQTIPSDDFAKLMREALSGNQMYTLDMGQSTALSTIVDSVREAYYYNQKKVIIVQGGAGTGKSIIAVNALGQLNSPKKKSDRITTFFVTVNAAPKKVLFNGLTAGKVFKSGDIKALFKYPTAFANRPNGEIPCLLIDEAHRIFEMKNGVGLKAGTNMLRELINVAKVAVFFIDDNQAVTKDDYATIPIICEIAKECHSQVVMEPELELSGQYRVQGGAEYIEFVKGLLGLGTPVSGYDPNRAYDFRLYDDPNEMFDEIKRLDTESRKQQASTDGSLVPDISPYNGHSRVVAGYCYEWVSTHDKRDGVADVIIPAAGFAKKWNLQYGTGITAYSWADDPLSVDEIGCIHTCQGIDLDYCGVIIGKDVAYENGKIVFHKEAHPKTDKSGIRDANDTDAETWIKNTYYVLLTRGVKGTFVYCEDSGLRDFIRSHLKLA